MSRAQGHHVEHIGGHPRRRGIAGARITITTRPARSHTRLPSPRCPVEGTALPAGPTALDAAANVAGLVALPNRAALRRGEPQLL
jgi:hypothetical protein